MTGNGSREPGSLELICAFAARIGVMTPLVRRSWGWLLELCFGLLCLRFLSAVLMENRPDIWPTMVLLAGSFGLGCWRPSAGLLRFCHRHAAARWHLHFYSRVCSCTQFGFFSALSLKGVGSARQANHVDPAGMSCLIVDAFASAFWSHCVADLESPPYPGILASLFRPLRVRLLEIHFIFSRRPFCG